MPQRRHQPRGRAPGRRRRERAGAAGVEGATSLEVELQADCLAGAWTRFADDQGTLAFGDREAAVTVLARLVGDPEGTRVDDPAVHGPGSLRAYWFLKGYYEGVGTCLL